MTRLRAAHEVTNLTIRRHASASSGFACRRASRCGRLAGPERPCGSCGSCSSCGQISRPADVSRPRRRHAGQARPLLDRATEIYERLGAARDLARAEAVLRGASIRRGRRGSRGRPQFGWSSLTPAERMVASLVAEGRSNPQIGDRLYISHRTVQTHLAHVFAKLDLTSRAQLAAEATRREAP